ncbi:putative septum site-determining protein MinC [Alistipes sp. CAG:831]|nr:putative septum site-determining protein MinC [Alistipes sp. CAG:831]
MSNRRTLTIVLQVVAVAALLLILFLIFNNRRPASKDLRQVEEVRNTVLLDKGWQFHRGDSSEVWEDVTIPHDWAIYGPFSRDNDLQTVAIVQNGEETASVKTGRTGGLPYVGVGWYRRTLNVTPGMKATLLFDGAMSEARVYVNGQEVIFWPYGYNSFYCDITPFLNPDGQDNELRVRLENRPQSSRWYPGAGLYRNVRLIETRKVHIPVWGTYITTDLNPSKRQASVNIRTEIAGITTEDIVALITDIRDASGSVVTSIESLTGASQALAQGGTAVLDQKVTVEQPSLWSPENPTLYTAFSRVYTQNAAGERELADTYTTTFGIRSIEVRPETGFYLNGVNRKFQGVCLHHDLGPLGAAVNVSALRHQLTMLKDMGCDAIRTTHNMPAPELIQLCDEMGFMVMVENFDEWDVAKCANGYHRYFDEWAERDMVNMLRHYRNNPSVVMWSVGNEVPTQWTPGGYEVAKFLQDICHREDPTRPVTCGMDQIDAILHNGFGAVFDVPGFNYRAHRYVEGYETLPQKVLLGSETSSTVSSRGVYKFPVEKKYDALYDDHQSSSYDLEYCSWSNVPDDDLALAEDYPWTMGQFVWTGFDYLGEPSPYDTDAWPNHSSMFGIIDLASIPKDRYWLYRSVWNQDSPTLHILPHWNWEGREGEVTPVYVYTSYPKAELFLNGKSLGVREKCDSTLQHRFRLMWNDVRYEPGELTVVAYDSEGNKAMQKSVRTASEPYALELIPARESITADGKDLLYVTVRIVDQDGNLCPLDSRKVRFDVSGAGKFRAVANGDPTCLELFHIPEMSAFGGMLTAIVQSSEQPGRITLTASADGLRDGVLRIKSEKQ